MSLVENSAIVRERVIRAQRIQYERQQSLNAYIKISQLNNSQFVSCDALEFLSIAIEKLGQSARTYHRLIKVARTIADLEIVQQEASKTGKVETRHIKEALAFRL